MKKTITHLYWAESDEYSWTIQLFKNRPKRKALEIWFIYNLCLTIVHWLWEIRLLFKWRMSYALTIFKLFSLCWLFIKVLYIYLFFHLIFLIYEFVVIEFYCVSQHDTKWIILKILLKRFYLYHIYCRILNVVFFTL